MSGYLPNMNTIPQDIKMVREFRGYNHNPVIGDGEFFELQNISCEQYPLMSARRGRSLVKTGVYAMDAVGADHMAWVDEGHLYYNGSEVVKIDFIPDWTPRLVRMGAYICVFPHGVVYNTQDGTVEEIRFEHRHNKSQTGANNIVLHVVVPSVDANGERHWEIPEGGTTIGDEEPQNAQEGDWWIRTNTNPRSLLRYSETQQMWISVPTVYLAIECAGIIEGVKEGDGIKISGFEGDYAFLNSAYTVEGVEYNGDPSYKLGRLIVTAPRVPEFLTWEMVNADIVVRRDFPYMDFVCEMGNRLYGCSSENHEVYASKLGDPFNWNVFQGVSTDSYAATVGSPGPFTGCIGYRDSVLFFKEDCIHILSGTRPATFQLDTLESNGVQRGSDKSLCIVNETLYFKGTDGYYAYAGGLPQFVSMQLGEKNTGTAYASGTDGVRYYTYLLDKGAGSRIADARNVFVYDTRRGIWTREDDLWVSCFASLGTVLYAFDQDGNVWCLNAERGDVDGRDEEHRPTYAWEDPVPEKTVEWSATSGVLGLDSPFGKYFSGIRLRLQMERGAVFAVSVSYDESGHFQEVTRITVRNTKSFNIGINVRRSDTMRIRFSGRDGFKLYSVSYVTEQGGDV